MSDYRLKITCKNYLFLESSSEYTRGWLSSITSTLLPICVRVRVRVRV